MMADFDVRLTLAEPVSRPVDSGFRRRQSRMSLYIDITWIRPARFALSASTDYVLQTTTVGDVTD